MPSLERRSWRSIAEADTEEAHPDDNRIFFRLSEERSFAFLSERGRLLSAFLVPLAGAVIDPSD